jgi:hypothetical protein
VQSDECEPRRPAALPREEEGERMTAPRLHPDDVAAIARAVAEELRGDAAPKRSRRERPKRVASADAHERIAAKNRRYSAPR